MGPILDLVTGDGKRLVDVMHLHLFRPTLGGVMLGVVTVIDPHVDHSTPLSRLPFVGLRCWDSREALIKGGGYAHRREQDGVKDWYVSMDEALKVHVQMVQDHSNAMVQRALASIGK